ncbi:MAG: DUF1801 domain-containing protein, partial [Saprospiraceae bacterium]
MQQKKPTTIDEYIAAFPVETQFVLEQIRKTIKKAAPLAEEKISYGIAAFNFQNSNFIYFAGYKNHIGLYPAPLGIESFKKEIANYLHSKSTLQFPLDKPMPLRLITKIVKFRV